MEACALSKSTRLKLSLAMELQFQLQNEKVLLLLLSLILGPGLTCTSLLKIIKHKEIHVGMTITP